MSVRRTRYSVTHGADFSSDPSLIDSSRAAICENLIPDGAGYPEKRAGWRKLYDYTDNIYGLYRYSFGGVAEILVHTGTKLYRHAQTPVLLCSDMAEHVSRAYQNDSELIILDGSTYRIYTQDTEAEEGFEVKRISWDDTADKVVSEGRYTDGGAYIPTTSISNTPVLVADVKPYTVMNGTAYESVNKLSKWRRMTACGTSESGFKVIALEDMPVFTRIPDSSTVPYVKVNGIFVFVNGVRKKVAVRETDKTVVAQRFVVSCSASDCFYLKYDLVKTSNSAQDPDFPTVSPEKGQAWLVWHDGYLDTTPQVAGRDNIEIYYVAEADTDSDIQKCTVIEEYANRIFVTGNSEKPNYDWHSEVENPYYYPDLSYQKFGDNTPILGYLNSGSYQAVVKADGSAGGSVYLRNEGTLNGETVFPIKQMSSGVGGVSRDGFCNFFSDDLLLTQDGIFALTSYDLTQEKILSNRSYYIDGRLKHEDLRAAVLFRYKGYCICAAGTHAYILNANASRSVNYKGDYLYDCYYWTNVPIERVVTVGDTLYFSNGQYLCRFNDDIEGVERYNDDGKAISAGWGTKLDDDGDITRYKTMIKKGDTVTLKPYTRASAKIAVKTERTAETEVKRDTVDIFDWQDIDFSRVTFNSFDTLREVLINTKVKKYKRLQFVVRNDALNEGFGIVEINKHYAFGNFIKR